VGRRATRPVRAALPHPVTGRRGPEPGRRGGVVCRRSPVVRPGLTDPREAEQAAGRSAPMNPGRPVPVRSPFAVVSSATGLASDHTRDGPARNPRRPFGPAHSLLIGRRSTAPRAGPPAQCGRVAAPGSAVDTSPLDS
jgi:hypothetical protein